MVTSTVTHRALDGVTYALSTDLDLSKPATSVADVVVGGRLHEWTMGIDQLGDDVADALGVSGFDSELTYEGGLLRTAVSTEYDPQTELVEHPLLVVWQARRYSIITRLYNASVTDALTQLRALRPEETDNGITMSPDFSAGAAFAGPATVIKEVPGLGLLEMTAPTEEQTAQLPPWKGIPVIDGELYRDNLADGSPFFVMSTPQVWATVVPLNGTDVAAVPDLAARLSLSVVEDA